MKLPEFQSKSERLKFLVENQDKLIAQKKAEVKHADGIAFVGGPNMAAKSVNKAESKDEIFVKAVINTTNVMDSHDDVHLPGLWDKSLKENKMIMHLQEHKMEFATIIADDDDLKVYTDDTNFKDLGYSLEGDTQALVFESKVKRSRNKYMFEQYTEGRVKNHSVGMRYVKIDLAINDEEAGANYEVWEKHIDDVRNKEQAEAHGYFWAVKEAKVIEGSAVPLGSNSFTPTLEVKEPSQDTLNIEPLSSTQTKEVIKNFKFL